MPVTHAWVAYACRAARVGKPRWNPETRVWTTSAKSDEGVAETISITAGSAPRTVRVIAEWSALGGARAAKTDRETGTVRRIVTALMTGMQWALARRDGRERSL